VCAQINAEYAASKLENLVAKAKAQKRQNRSAQQISVIARNRSQTEIGILQQALAAVQVKAPAGGRSLESHNPGIWAPRRADFAHAFS
jgi:hypothetical protein